MILKLGNKSSSEVLCKSKKSEERLDSKDSDLRSGSHNTVQHYWQEKTKMISEWLFNKRKMKTISRCYV